MGLCSINPFMSNGLTDLNSLDRSVFNRRGVWLVFIIKIFYRIPVFNANHVDPDLTSHSAG